MSFRPLFSGTKKARPAGSRASLQWRPAEVAASPVAIEKRKGRGLVPTSPARPICSHMQSGLVRMQPCDLDDVVAKITSKDEDQMAPRPSVTRHPFTLMFVVIALMAPFAGLAWRTREWMGW